MVTQEKLQALRDSFARLEIRDSDIIETFTHGSTKGGQKANKSATGVRLKHVPTGIEVKCTETRERELNRFLARRLLAEKVEELRTGTSKRMKEIDKIRKQKARRKRKNRSKFQIPNSK